MKLISTVLSLTLISLSTTALADCSPASEAAALKFVNSYIRYLSKDAADSEQWVATNQQLMPEFKAAYKKLMTDARKTDPELGLGFDPILDAQDYVDKFTDITNCNAKTGVIWVSGKWNGSASTMQVAVLPKNIKNKWLIQGAGVINISKKQQAPRD